MVDRYPHHLHVSRYEVLRCHHVMDTIDDGKHTVFPIWKWYVTIFKPGRTHSIYAVCFRCTSWYCGGIDRHSILTLFELYGFSILNLKHRERIVGNKFDSWWEIKKK